MTRKSLTAIAGSMVCLATTAQNTVGDHQLRAGEEVRKVQVAYMEAAGGGQDAVWDFRDMEPHGKGYVVSFTEVPEGDSIIAGTERGTRYYYRQRGDSLLQTGYESNTARIRYDRPELLLHTPLAYGERHNGLFHGTAAYGERLFMRLAGSWLMEVDGTGSMLLPEGDTLRHVARVHLLRLTAEQSYPHVKTERELADYVGSIAPYTADSIRQRLLTDNSLTETSIYRWYAAGYRYPILETTAIGRKGETPAYTAAFYCPPSEQVTLDDEENEKIRQLLAKGDRGKSGCLQDACGRSPIRNVAVSVSGSTVSVCYEATLNATVEAKVCGVSGIVFRKQSQTSQAGNTCKMDIPCGGLRKGEYVLYLNANGQVTSSVICLR